MPIFPFQVPITLMTKNSNGLPPLVESTGAYSRLVERSALAIVLLLGVLGVVAARGLYADGSFFFITILKIKGFLSDDAPRAYAQIVTQIPLVAAIKLGVGDLNALIRLHSLGLIMAPIVFWMLALVIQFDKAYFGALLLAFSVTYLSSGFFAAGEYNVAYAMAAFCASLLCSERRDMPSCVALVATAFVLTCSYEALVFLGPVLAAMALYRYSAERRAGHVARWFFLVAAVLFVIAACISLRSILFPRSLENSSSAMEISPQLKKNHSVYMALILIAYVVSSLADKKVVIKAAVGISIVLSLVYLASPSMWLVPGRSYAFRAVSGIYMFVVLASIAAHFFLARRKARALAISPYSSAIAAIFFVTLCVPSYMKTLAYYGWAKRFEAAAIEAQSWVPVDQVFVDRKDRSTRDFAWGWTNPYLSIALRGNADAGVASASDYSRWELLKPEQGMPNPIIDYRKTRRLYP